MKRVHWTKVPAFKMAQSPDCIWMHLANEASKVKVNYDALELTFGARQEVLAQRALSQPEIEPTVCFAC